MGGLTHEARCKRLLDLNPKIERASLQLLMWMRKMAERRVRNTYDLKAQNEAANHFHAFDAACKAVAGLRHPDPDPEP